MNAWHLAVLLLVAAAPLRAQQELDDEGTDWTSVAVPTGPVAAPNTPESGFSNPEGIRFTEQMRRKTLDQICRGVDLAIHQSLGLGGAGGVGVGVERSLRPLPSGELALVDQDQLSVDLGHELIGRTMGTTHAAITVSAHLDGTSLVVRPLASQNACKGLLDVIKLTKIKTVVPVTASRLSHMEVGELWKLPTVLRIGHSESVAQAAAGAAENENVVVSFGIGQQGSAIMTAYRLSEDKVRFRLRVDHVRLHDLSGGVIASYPAVSVFTAGAAGITGMLERAVDHELANQISAVLTAAFQVGRASSDGQQLVMEFVLDPRDPEQMENLAKVMRGDLLTLAKMAGTMATLRASAARSRQDFEKVEGAHEAALGRPSAAPGLDLYHQVQHTLHLRFPVIFDHASSSSKGDDLYVSLADGAKVHLFHAEKTGSSNFLNVPLKGAMIKRDSLRSAQTFVSIDPAGRKSAPQAVYIYHEGFLRRDAADVRETAQDVSRLLSRAGTRGGPAVARLALPLDSLVPPQPPRQDQRDALGQEEPQPAAPSYHDGSLSLTLVLTAKAVKEILSADAPLIAQCVRATLDDTDRSLLDLALASKGFDAEGRLGYDWKQFYQAYGDSGDYRRWMENVCDLVTNVVADINDVRAQADPEARAKALTRLLSGGGRSGLAYDDILQVLIQLVEPRDMTADFRIDLNKHMKAEREAHAHLVLHKDRPENRGLERAARLKQRFARPSDLVD